MTIDRERVINTLVELCRLRSPSGEEHPVREYVRGAVSELGLTVTEDARGNLYVQTPAPPEWEPLFLCSHMDTVPVPADAQVSVVRKNGRISSDGTTILGGDDKQGIAAALEMLRLATTHPGHHRGIDAIFTVEEEVGSRGSRDVDVNLVRARQGFNLDGETEPGSAINRAPRKARFTATVTGRSSHAALEPEAGINAIVVASKIVAALPLGAPNPVSTSNVGTIGGGRQTNVVPHHAVFTGEIRSFDVDAFDTLRDRFNTIAEEVATAAGATVTMEWEETYGRYHVKESEPCAGWFIEACRRWAQGDRGTGQAKDNAKDEANGCRDAPRFVTSRGGGDANQLNNKGLRCIVFGLGMHNIHSVDEYVVEAEYLSAVELLASIVFPEQSGETE